jgi:acyl phosphate:glycerol-3-phosphate acyltransferase
MLTWAAAIGVAYLLGSIQSGLLIGRVFYGVDPRNFGSRRTGATNVLRTMGKKAAVAVVLLDFSKGALAVALAKWLLPAEPWAHVLAAFAVAAGHNWPVFFGFRGGKGVVVSGIATAVLYWPIFAVLVPVGLLVVWRTRYVSLGSMSGAIAAPIAAAYFYSQGMMPQPEYVIYCVIAGALVVLTHRENIARLLAGTENRLGQRVERTEPVKHVETSA